MEIRYFPAFIRELESLDRPVQNQIRKKLKEIHGTPPGRFSPTALKGTQFKGLYKLRIGDWRLIYKIVGREIHFITLGHRSEVYK